MLFVDTHSPSYQYSIHVRSIPDGNDGALH